VSIIMSFRDYLRWEGAIAIVGGASLFLFGLRAGHQGALDAAFSGIVMLAGTSVFMLVRHSAPLREPGTWFTAKPLATANGALAACPRGRLLLALALETVIGVVAVVALSYATRFWLTYMDCGVWAIAIGAIKAGPAAGAVERHERRAGRNYQVARRPVRGLVELTEASTATPR
jgi:hypothetical protein